MTKEYFDMEDWEFDNTKTHDFRKCPALGYWRWVRKIETVWPNGHLIFGSACHEGAAIWNAGMMTTQQLGLSDSTAYKQLTTDTLSKIAAEMETMPDNMGSKNLQNAEILTELVVTHPNLQGTITAVEERYERQLYYDHNTSQNILYFGKVDLCIIQHNIDKVIDYKSTGNLRNNFFDSFFLSNQPRGYCWLTGARTFIVAVLHAIKSKCSYSGELGPCIHVQDYFYDDHEIDRWEQEIQATISHIYNNIMRIRNNDDIAHYTLFPRYATMCQPPNFGCPYQRLCEQPCAAEDVMIDYSVYKEG